MSQSIQPIIGHATQVDLHGSDSFSELLFAESLAKTKVNEFNLCLWAVIDKQDILILCVHSNV
jgi:hypothetical protein